MDNPYPTKDLPLCLDPRVEHLEQRIAAQEERGADIKAEAAFLKEANSNLRADVHELVEAMKETNASIRMVNDKVDNKFKVLITSVWSLIALLVPTAIGIIGIWQTS